MRTFALPFVSLAMLASSLLADELPRVHLAPGTRREVRGDRVFQALDVQGRAHFYKRTGARGSRAAEVLIPRLLRRAGVATPRVRPVRVAGLPGEYLQIESVDRAWAKSAGPIRDADMHAARWRRRVDLDTLRTIQLVDTITANADRHGGNLLGARENHRFFPRGKDRLRVIPIDHDLAMMPPEDLPAKARGERGSHLYGLTEDLGRPLSLHEVVAQRGPVGSPAHTMASNDLARAALHQAARDPRAAQAYVDESRRLRAALSDDVLRVELDRLTPADLGGPDPEARRKQLYERLRARRDGLPGWLEEAKVKSGLGPAEGASARRPTSTPANSPRATTQDPATSRGPSVSRRHAAVTASSGAAPRRIQRARARGTRVASLPRFRLRIPRPRLMGRRR